MPVRDFVRAEGQRDVERRYSAEHLWVVGDGPLTTIGVTPYIAGRIGSPQHWQPPDVGAELVRGEVFGEIEAGKVVCELTAPVTGGVVEVNEQVRDVPATIIDDPYGTWLVRLAGVGATDLNELLSEAEYHAYLTEGGVVHPFERRFSPPS